jgi:replicative DNA helicase
MVPTPQTLPHSEEAERAVLAAPLVDAEHWLTLAEHLRVGDFYLEGHQLIFTAMQELVSGGTGLDVLTVHGWLESRGHSERAGGLGYLTGLDVLLPDLSRLGQYVEMVRERSVRREVLEASARWQGELLAGTLPAGTVVNAARRELEALEALLPGGSGLRPAFELVGSVVGEAERRREERERTGRRIWGLATGLPRLDQLLGGLQPGLHLLAGAPGVGKTTLALQMALHVAREAPVVYVSFENSSANLLTKALCQWSGINTEDVARGTASAALLAESAEEFRPVLERLYLVDGDGHLTPSRLASQARQAMVRAGSSTCLVVVDYLQLWAKTSRDLRGFSETRGKVDALGGELIDLARRLGSPVLSMSSQSRAAGGYGRGGGEASLDSFKESGDLEYAADTALFLTEARERPAEKPAVAVDLTVRKNRHGSLGTVELIYRPQRGTLRELRPEESGARP